MNSLVVLFSVLALAAAKPSGALLGGGLLAYSAPAAAVSHTARLDIRDEPAIVAAPAVAPIARTIIAEPTIVSAPAAVSHQSRIDIKSEPTILTTAAVAPIARTLIAEPAVAVAPAAVSHQSRIDINSAPAVIETIASAPLAYSAPIATAAVAPALVRTAAIAPTILKAATLATAGVIAAPAAVAGPVVPLDTPEVIAARAAHFQAKAEALARAHIIHKRSATLVAPAAPLVAAPLAYSAPIAPITHVAPIAYSTPLIAKAYSVHPW